MLIDSHAHLCSSEFADIHDVLKRAHEKGVTKIINIATSLDELERGIALKQQYPWIYNAAATHPHDASGEDLFPLFEKRGAQLVAIGETGLDYFYEHGKKEDQQSCFRRYIDLAKKRDLPLLIHCREAYTDLFRIFDEEKYTGKAVLHCFTGTKEEAFEGLRRGFLISISGIVTFKKSDLLRKIVKEIPLDRLIVETDCPFLAPQSQRGKRNEPSFVVETAQYIAPLKGVSFEELAKITTNNVINYFKI